MLRGTIESHEAYGQVGSHHQSSTSLPVAGFRGPGENQRLVGDSSSRPLGCAATSNSFRERVPRCSISRALS